MKRRKVKRGKKVERKREVWRRWKRKKEGRLGKKECLDKN